MLKPKQHNKQDSSLEKVGSYLMSGPGAIQEAYHAPDMHLAAMEPYTIHCSECGGFLKHDPDSSEWVENKYEVEYITEDYSHTRHHRKCTKCGVDNLDDDF